MQSSTRLVILVNLVTATFLCAPAAAQMFGGRAAQQVPMNNFGAPNNPAFGGGAGATISGSGQPSLGISRPQQGADRFLRQNRSPRDFVGQNRAELRTFVGAQQALTVGQVRSATEGLRPDNSNARRVNRPIPPQPSKGMYYPKLEMELGDDDDRDGINDETATESTESGREVDAKLLNRLRRIGGPSVQISLSATANAGTVATLTGQVNSKRTVDLAEQLLSFEPGVDKVINRLEVMDTSR